MSYKCQNNFKCIDRNEVCDRRKSCLDFNEESYECRFLFII